MARITYIEFPVFSGYSVHVEVTPDIAKAVLKYPATAHADVDSETLGLTSTKGGKVSFVFLKPNATPGIIAHESWHAVENLIKYVGAEIESEMVAYHLDYLVDRIFKFVNKGKS